MTNQSRNEYKPDYMPPPGATLQETLETIGMSLAELASCMQQPEDMVSAIIQGEDIITPEIAGQLERVLHVSTDFWLRLEQNYRKWLAQSQADELFKQRVFSKGGFWRKRL